MVVVVVVVLIVVIFLVFVIFLVVISVLVVVFIFFVLVLCCCFRMATHNPTIRTLPLNTRLSLILTLYIETRCSCHRRKGRPFSHPWARRGLSVACRGRKGLPSRCRPLPAAAVDAAAATERGCGAAKDLHPRCRSSSMPKWACRRSASSATPPAHRM